MIAQFERAPDRYTVWSNFQGPFVIQPLMAGALRVPGHRLRLITPPASGGSFGIKQAILSPIVLLAAVSRKAGVPVKWIEDRAEHLTAASASSDRLGTIAAAFTRDGELTALRFKNVANMGAFIRAPEPASLYRMHAASNGCYRVRNIAVDNELVVTNRTPVGLNRGYGGPQFYFALERMMEIAARGLGIDPAELRRRNFVPADAFPYTAPAGAVLDAGDYEAALAELLRIADYEALKQKRDEARRAGRLFGIGFAAGVEPSGSNMAYVSLAQTAQDRNRADRKSGARRQRRDLGRSQRAGHAAPVQHAERAGPRHRRRADRRRCAGPCTRRYRRRHRDRHADERVVDRVGQLLQPLCRGRGRCHRAVGRAGRAQDQAAGGAGARSARRRHRAARRLCPRARPVEQGPAVPQGGVAGALGPRGPAGRHGAGHS